MKKLAALIAIMLLMAVLPPSGFSWRYDSSYDRMRDEQTKLAYIQSNTILNFAFPYQGGSKAKLILKENKHQGLIVALQVDRGQFNCSSIEPCSVYAKFDSGKVLEFYVEPPASGNADLLLFHQGSAIVDLLKKSKHLTLEAEFFMEGTRQIEFDVAGLQWEPEAQIKEKEPKEVPVVPEKPRSLAELYYEAVKNTIRRRWKPPDQNVGNLETMVFFVLSNDGQLLSLQIEKPSGNSLFDEAALRAIREAAPMPPVPSFMGDLKKDFRLKFTPNDVFDQ